MTILTVFVMGIAAGIWILNLDDAMKDKRPGKAVAAVLIILTACGYALVKATGV